jgi:hypothetical protein
MPRTRFGRTGLLLLLVAGCVVFGDCGLIQHAQAQPSSAPSAPSGPPPTPPTQSPTVNPSNPSTVTQPSYTPLTPSTPSTTPSTPSATTPSTAPSGELTRRHQETSNTTARSEQPASVTKPRSIHHHYGRSRLATYSCGSLGCVRTYAWAFPCQYYSRYCLPPSFYVHQSP